jgi:hypothetical protein
MSATGGSVPSISLSGRSFAVDAEADLGQMFKKFENEVKANGNGSLRLIRKAIPQVLDGIGLSIDDSLNDMEYLNDLNDNGDGDPDGMFNVTVVMPSGAIYSGRGQFIGDIKKQTQESMAEVTINCFGMRKQ